MRIRKVDMKDAVGPLAEYASQVEGGGAPVVVTAAGRAVAAVIPVSEDDLEMISLSTNPRFIELIEESRRSLAREGGITSEEMRRRLGLSKPASGE